MKHKFLILTLLFTSIFQSAFNQNKIEVKGILVDGSKNPIPYAAIGIPSKYIGTASTSEGSFYLNLSKWNLKDSLEISSIGFKTKKILVKDYIESKIKEIVLKENVVSLSEMKLLSPKEYVKLCVKNLKRTTLSQPHKLDVLFRRFSSEDGKTRFLIEHYLHVVDRGPSSRLIMKMKVVEGRKSADYRFVKRKSHEHNMNWTARHNPIRNNFSIKSYHWKRVGDTSYDGEDIIIIEGRKKKQKEEYLRLYIGIDTYGLYKIENSVSNTTYIYKKNKDGKLYLSYHNRDVKFYNRLNTNQKLLLKTSKNLVPTALKFEVYILGLNTNKKSFRFKNYGQFKIDMSDIEIKYNPQFWNNFNLPPETNFYKQNVQEIESIYGVPIEKQFEILNKLN